MWQPYFFVTPKGFEPPSEEPESSILSIKLRGLGPQKYARQSTNPIAPFFFDYICLISAKPKAPMPLRLCDLKSFYFSSSVHCSA